MSNYRRTWTIVGTLIVVGLVTAILATMFGYPLPPEAPPASALFQTLSTVLGALNITILIILLITYVGIYRKTKSEFTIGLIVFSILLLMQSISSLPFFIRVFGFQGVWLGPFLLFPPLFIFIALLVLLYLTIK